MSLFTMIGFWAVSSAAVGAIVAAVGVQVYVARQLRVRAAR